MGNEQPSPLIAHLMQEDYWEIARVAYHRFPVNGVSIQPTITKEMVSGTSQGELLAYAMIPSPC